MNRFGIVGFTLIAASTASQADAVTYFQVADTGQIVSYTYSQFLNGTGGLIVGQASGYGDDAGFFYQSVLDRYFQVADTGQIVSYTYSQFLNGTGGLVVGQANGYGDDAGFFSMSDGSDNPAPGPAPIPLPASLPLLAISIGVTAALRVRRTPAKTQTPD